MLSFLHKLVHRTALSPQLSIQSAYPLMHSEPASNFLWLDTAHVEHKIQQRWRRGEITTEEASLLKSWSTDGYVILENCVPHDLIDAAFEDLEKAWQERSHIGIDVLTDGRRTYVDQEDADIRCVPYKLNDFYLFSDHVRQIFFNERIVRFGELVFGDCVVGCNSLTFERGTQQPPHVDHAYMTPTPARRLIAAWVACEDIGPEAGPLLLWPGSHRLPPYDFGGSRYHYTPELDSEHSRYLDEQKRRFPQREFLARKGDVLIWHALLIHGGSVIRNHEITRKSMAFHYFSRECVLGLAAEDIRSYGSAFYLTKPASDAS